MVFIISYVTIHAVKATFQFGRVRISGSVLCNKLITANELTIF